jgi:hypothetical protein
MKSLVEMRQEGRRGPPYLAVIAETAVGSALEKKEDLPTIAAQEI